MGGSESKPNDGFFACCATGDYGSDPHGAIPDSELIKDFKEFNFNRTVNESLNAVLSEYVRAKTQETFMVKMINFNSKEEFEDAYREAYNLWWCRYIHVVPFRGYHVRYSTHGFGDKGSMGTFCIFMDSMTNSLRSELTNRIMQGRTFDKKEMNHLIKCTIDGLRHIHERRLTHRNVKPTNILLKKAEQSSMQWSQLPDVKIADIYHDKKKKTNLTRSEEVYVAPEVRPLLAGTHQGEVQIDWQKADIYSLGIVLLEALLLQDLRNIQLDDKRKEDLLKSKAAEFPEQIAIISEMLKTNPADRPNTATIYDRVLLNLYSRAISQPQPQPQNGAPVRSPTQPQGAVTANAQLGGSLPARPMQPMGATGGPGQQTSGTGRLF